MGTHAGAVAVVLSVLASPGAAQREPRAFVRVEVGQAEIHRHSSTGAAIALRLGRRVVGSAVIRFDLGVVYSTADSGYLVLEGGAELRPFAKGRVTPILGAGGGYIVERSYRGAVLRGTLALEVEIAVRLAVRFGAHFASHANERGPHMYFVGIEPRGWVR